VRWSVGLGSPRRRFPARRALACSLGTAEPYADNDVSASRYTTKVRDDFAKLLGALRSGRFDAAMACWMNGGADALNVVLTEVGDDDQ
jgi:hypothetical protein